MMYQHISSKFNARLTKIERDFIKQFSSIQIIKNALLLGNADQGALLQDCCCQSRHFFCQSYPQQHTQNLSVCLGRFTELPYAPASMDLVVLPHILEFSNQPKIILEQALGCVNANGLLILFSFSSIGRHLNPNKKIKPTLLSANATKQLINQAGLEIIVSQSFFSPLSYAPNTKLARLIDHILTPHLPFLCHAYIIVAQKITAPYTPMPLKSYTMHPLSLALESRCTTQLGKL